MIEEEEFIKWLRFHRKTRDEQGYVNCNPSFAETWQAATEAMQAKLDAKDIEIQTILCDAMEAMEYHREQTRPIERTNSVIAQIREILGKGN